MTGGRRDIGTRRRRGERGGTMTRKRRVEEVMTRER
jgi:hypothetical protein